MKFITTIEPTFERQAQRDGYIYIAGVDEVGRGCLAGPVVAGAAILDLSKPLPYGLDDSKKISKKNRQRIAAELRDCALSYSVGQIEADEIDKINILEATKRAMIRAIRNLKPSPEFLLIDALELKDIDIPQKRIIRGDSLSPSIAAASIIAKVYRDDLMTDLASDYPEYGFERHAGYGTKAHFEALRTFGATKIHRKSFRGVII